MNFILRTAEEANRTIGFMSGFHLPAITPAEIDEVANSVRVPPDSREKPSQLRANLLILNLKEGRLRIVAVITGASGVIFGVTTSTKPKTDGAL
jgi:hypothetical protein